MTPQAAPITERLVDIKTVCAVLCRSRASIYRDIQRGDFPEPIKLRGSSRWKLSDLNKVMNGEGAFAA